MIRRRMKNRIPVLGAMFLAALACGAARGASVENQGLVVTAEPGASGIVVRAKSGDASVNVELRLVGTGGATGTIDKAEIAKGDGDEQTLRLTAGTAEAEVALGRGGPFVTVRPGKGAESLEVRATAKYALLPDFFADDVVYDPRRFKSPQVSVPAENFLLHLAGDGSSIVMCVWQGGLELKKQNASGGAADSPAGGESREARVDLVFAGEGATRRIAASRIEFAGKPVYVGLLAGKGIWRDEDVSGQPTAKDITLSWKRPFDAKWRGDLVVKDGPAVIAECRKPEYATIVRGYGQKMGDWSKLIDLAEKGQPVTCFRTRFESREFRSVDAKAGPPRQYMEAIGQFVWPCWFKNDETHLTLKDNGLGPGNSLDRENKKRKEEGKEAIYPPNFYERVLIYPLDRTTNTPLEAYTVVDVMRGTLGQGPCEYVLDLEGVKPRPRGGDRELIETALCPLFDNRIYPLLGKLGKGDKLTDKEKTTVAQVCEDMKAFAHGVLERIREYERFGQALTNFCAESSARMPQVKPSCEAIEAAAQGMLKDIGRLDSTTFGFTMDREQKKGVKELIEYWDQALAATSEDVKADKYDRVRKMGAIKGYGDFSDPIVARCRMTVKTIRQEATLSDSGDPAVTAFAAKVREMCRQIMRHKHPKEGI